jgi:hypothetical protein
MHEESYTPEDGHVGRNMLWKTVETTYNKGARRRKHNLQYPVNNTMRQDAKI